MSSLKILAVKTQSDYQLLVKFNNGIQKLYDCTNLLHLDFFQPLSDKSFFSTAKVDQGGYGVVWDDAIDISEQELWSNGIEFYDENHLFQG